MSTNDNTTVASVTHSEGTRVTFAETVTKQKSSATLSDSRTLLIKDRKFDPAREFLETQQEPFKSTMCDIIHTFSTISNAMRKKRAGISKMETDESFVPQSARVNTKLQHLESLKEDEATKTNVLEIEQLNKAHQMASKRIITAQSKLDALHTEKKNNTLLITLLLNLAKHQALYLLAMYDSLENPIDSLGLGDTTLGAIALTVLMLNIETTATDTEEEADNEVAKEDLSIPDLFSQYLPLSRRQAVEICKSASLKEGQASITGAGLAALVHCLTSGKIKKQTLLPADANNPEAHFDHEILPRTQSLVKKICTFVFNFLKFGLVPLEKAIVREHRRKCALLQVQIAMKKQKTISLGDEIQENIQAEQM